MFCGFMWIPLGFHIGLNEEHGGGIFKSVMHVYFPRVIMLIASAIMFATYFYLCSFNAHTTFSICWLAGRLQV